MTETNHDAMRPTNSWRVLRHRDVRLAVLGSFVWSVASTMEVVAIGYVLYKATGSKADLGLLGLAEFIPSFVLVLVTGSYADRHDRRYIAAWSLALQAVVAIGLYFGVRHGITTVTPFLGAALGYGVAKAFAAPATRSLIPAVCPPEELQAAMPIGSLSWQAATIGGPVIGGVLAGWSVSGVFGVVAIIYALNALVFLAIGPRGSADTGHGGDDGEEAPTGLTHALEGLKLVRREPVVFGAISLDLMAVLFGGAVALLPAVAEDRLHVGATGFGLLRAATGIGGVLMGLVLAAKPPNRSVGRMLLIAVAVFGAATIVFGLSRNYWLSFAMLMLLLIAT